MEWVKNYISTLNVLCFYEISLLLMWCTASLLFSVNETGEHELLLLGLNNEYAGEYVYMFLCIHTVCTLFYSPELLCSSACVTQLMYNGLLC